MPALVRTSRAPCWPALGSVKFARRWPWAAVAVCAALAWACGDDRPGNSALDAGISFEPADATIGADGPVSADTDSFAPPPDLTAGDAAAAVCPGGPGCACQQNAECDNALCIETPSGLACAVPCVANCPENFACKAVSGPSGDIVSVCVPKFLRLCDPCATSADCASLGLTGASCVLHGDQGAFCGVACAVAADCPGGYTCADAPTAEGPSSKQCVRASADPVCVCSAAASAKGLKTACGVTAIPAGGSAPVTCKGTRQCGKDGLGVCLAAPATAETCNGLDDDCDGQIDEVACDDGLPCTKDSCDAKAGCSHAPTPGAPCDADGSACTVGDQCAGGACVAGAAIVCDDGKACTTDACAPASGCTATNDDGKGCDADGDACTKGDACAGGACVKGAVVVCDDGNPCTADGCDGKTGKCAAVAVGGGVPCDDGTACTLADACTQGTCAGKPVDCDDKNPCTAETCDPAKGCQKVNADAAGCDDDNPCSVGDSCKDGACVGGKPKSCVAPDECSTAKCDLGTGKCAYGNAQNGTPCDDGSACTEADACQAGTCAGKLLACNDANPCTSDKCDKQAGCVNSPNSSTCDDGDACTTGDTCAGGACKPGANQCECKNDTDCAAKEDGDLCNGTLFCDLAKLPHQCKVNSKTVVVCDASGDSECLKNLCTAATGKCAVAGVNGGKSCSDGNACTSGDVCGKQPSGSWGCVAGAAVSCDDGSVCTKDSCGPSSGCLFTPDPGVTLPCYSGPNGTAGKGICSAGTKACLADG
ncbi:MAG: hypothetical protein FJ100_23595, partial [Deltaproteobacteria bacterium]|nr:hypothetical protein [Deltaproteobacteria bacterium]